jgi:hypothetical protein
MLTAIVPPAHQPVARIGDTVVLRGHDLDGTGRQVLLSNDRFGVDITIGALPPPATGADGMIAFVLDPALAATLAVGVYRIGARLVRPGATALRETNRLAVTLAPQMTNLPLAVVRDGRGNASFTIEFVPALRAGQTVALVLGQDEFLPQGSGSPSAQLGFAIPNAPIGAHLARLRIDGIDSPIIDLSATPPTFLNQRVVIS